MKELSKTGPTLSGLEKLDENMKTIQILWNESNQHSEKPSKIKRVCNIFDEINKMLKEQRTYLGRIAQPLYPVYLQLLRLRISLFELKKANEVFTCYDVSPIQLKLIELEEEYIENGNFLHQKDDSSAYKSKQLDMILMSGQAILRIFLEHCYRQANLLLQSTDYVHVDPTLRKTYNELHSLRRKLERMKYHKFFTEEDILKIQKALSDISASRVDGKFMNGSTVPKGQAILCGLLEQNFEICHELLVSYNPVSKNLKPVYNELVTMKNELEVIANNSKYFIDPIDVIKYYQRLTEIEESKGNGALVEKITRSSSFMSGVSTISDDTETPQGQSVIHYMLQKCYRLVYNILTAAEPVDASIKGIQSQLLALRRCLQELKNSHQGPINESTYCLSPLTNRYDPVLRREDLIPVQLKLSAIDKIRKDGKFLNKDGEIPPGQSTLNSLLNECYDSLYELLDIADQNELVEQQVMEDNSVEAFSDSSDYQDYLGPANLPVIPIISV